MNHPQTAAREAAPFTLVEQDHPVVRESVPAAAPNRQLSVVEYAVQSGAPVSEVRALVELQIQMDNHKLALRKQDDERERELRQEAARNAYAEAMASFKADGVRVIRNKQISDGPLKGKKHADLFAVTDAATEVMSKYGLSSSWETLEDTKEWIRIACRIKHVKGHSESVSFGGPIDTGPGRNAIQARKSTVTYLERITMLLALGLAEQDADDDGVASGPPATAVPPIATRPEPRMWPDDAFATQFARWAKAVDRGIKTPADILAMARSKGALTPEQEAQILALKKATVPADDTFVADIERAERAQGGAQ